MKSWVLPERSLKPIADLRPVQSFVDAHGGVLDIAADEDQIYVFCRDVAIPFNAIYGRWGMPLDLLGQFIGTTKCSGVVVVATTEGIFELSR